MGVQGSGFARSLVLLEADGMAPRWCGDLDPLGSVARNVAKHARCPVPVARVPEQDLRRVLLALDDSEHAQQALQFCSRLPLPVESEGLVLKIVRPDAPFPGLVPTDRAEFNAVVRKATTGSRRRRC